MHIYLDVTKNYLKTATPYSHEIKFDTEYTDENNIAHPIEGKEVAHKQSENSEEYSMAMILQKEIGGDIHLIPRITDISNSGLKTPTPDFLWNDEKWDLKTPIYKKNYDNLLNDIFKKKDLKKQSNKFIVDYQNYPHITANDIEKNYIRFFRNKYTNWIK